ncbi:MAG: glycosyl hydrolase, partial [Schleiferiaceae bacterium]|nr:glycosyl hydrolase [Schleiferiaceae bacterium]
MQPSECSTAPTGPFMKRLFQSTLLAACTVLLAANAGLQAQTVPVGSGSYTKTFPGVDAAGRNGYPSGTPFTTGQAAQRPVPTNDWWSNKLKNPHSDNLFTYPFTLKTKNSGLVVTYIPWGPIDNIEPVVVGVSGLNAPQARVADYSDWTVTMDWTAGTKQFGATAGLGMPFLHFTKGSSDVATVQVNQGTATVANEVLRIENARNGADFAVYAPVGSVWVQSGNTYTSTLNGKNYWSLAFLPLTAPSVAAAAAQFAPYAYVVPVNTRAEWSYNAATSVVTTQFTADVAVKEGLDSVLLMGLLPHQWSSLAPGSAAPSGPTYPTVRGTLKCLAANAFTVQDTFHGILPTLPYVDPYSAGFQPLELSSKIQLLQNDPLATWTDSYNEGQEMNRLIQTARAAELTQDTAAFGLLFQTVKERLEDWLHYQSGEVAFLFYYNSTWSALLGYPAGHGQDLNLNDHHFHWGYFIHAASFVEQFEPGWAASWGPMINLLVRDAASPRRNDALFPYLRSFSPYAGHSWANGFATFPQGNDQESTSESMQFNSSLIHWGSVTGNDSIRNLGIYLYVTEQRAVEEYWFDQRQRNFGPTQPHALVSRVWGNSYDNGTFWTGDIAASFGIELYPIHGGSLYLGHDTLYAHQLWLEMEQKTGILSNAPNVNLWHDIYWQYLSFTNPQKALNLYNSYPGRSLKFGVSDAFTYHWLHAMNALGRVAKGIRANHPLAAAFIRAGDTTYVAQNYGATPKTVLFSTGYALTVPPRTLATSKDIALKGALTTSFPAAYPGGTVTVSAQVTGGTPTQVVFFCGDTAFAAVAQAPFTAVSPPLPSGKHAFYARVYSGASFALTNVAAVLVGDQIPYSGTPHTLPGTFPAGHYDAFSGGNASGVAYQDG